MNFNHLTEDMTLKATETVAFSLLHNSIVCNGANAIVLMGKPV